MKRPLTLLMLLLGAAAHAQTAPKISVADGLFQRVSVRAYAGRPYRLSARVQVDTAASDGADAWIAASVLDSKTKWLSSARLPQNIKDAQWRTYSVQGKLSKQADSLQMVLGYYMNGRFGFDDFLLEVEAAPGQWLKLPLLNADFEGAGPLLTGNQGWRQFQQVTGFTQEVATDTVGNHYLRTTGQHIVPYGRNKSTGHYAVVNGVKLYYETYGQGEPLLLLHGNGESISSFRQQIGTLAKQYQVIAVDTRDQGKSAATKGRLSYDLFADDIHALLEHLHVPAAHIVGWSDGGNTGLSMALRYPAQVKSLVTMGANLYADTTAVDAKLLKEVRHTKRILTLLGPFKKQWHKGYRLSTLLLNYPNMKPAELRAITAPVLVLAGEKDVIKEAHTRLIAQNIPRSQLVILPGLTHYAPQENGPLFNQTVLQFLNNAEVK
ncbi:alpha/beta fold hydrolase [Hymenobacter sp. BT730]|uniref:alpha/beta fold hydrolase n=1 Tax=Hymenobacter sp. BT730 TaxID=3063332 RepID=UPI0026DF2A72|nr:alpha/beta hydrolase [Hymenobacter sp. BT730]